MSKIDKASEDLLILQSKWTALADTMSVFKYYLKEGIVNEFDTYLEREVEEYKRMVEQQFKRINNEQRP